MIPDVQDGVSRPDQVMGLVYLLQLVYGARGVALAVRPLGV